MRHGIDESGLVDLAAMSCGLVGHGWWCSPPSETEAQLPQLVDAPVAPGQFDLQRRATHLTVPSRWSSNGGGGLHPRAFLPGVRAITGHGTMSRSRARLVCGWQPRAPCGHCRSVVAATPKPSLSQNGQATIGSFASDSGIPTVVNYGWLQQAAAATVRVRTPMCRKRRLESSVASYQGSLCFLWRQCSQAAAFGSCALFGATTRGPRALVVHMADM